MIGRVRIAIVGFGLIGGSIARALARPEAAAGLAGPIELAAWSRTPASARVALADGVIGRARRRSVRPSTGPTSSSWPRRRSSRLDLLGELGGALAGALAAGATITDVASTKAVVIERADRLGLRFVGGHPMAGRDATGYAAAEADLFVDRPWVVCPGANAAPSDVDRVERLARATGAHGRSGWIRPPTTGRSPAISHAPLIVSAALVEAVAESGPTGRSPGRWPPAAGAT